MTYGYDADGRQTSAGSRTFAWNAMGRIASTTLSSTTTAYTYDGAGTRTLASTGTEASKNTNYDWDPNGAMPQLVAERDGSSALIRRYKSGLDTLTLDTGGTPFYYHYDGLGSAVNLTSSTGVTQWTYDYLPYGGVRTETKNQSQAPANVLRYTGELLDPTGLYHLRARQFDVGTGQFLGVDPAAPGAREPYVSPYAYVNGNPINLSDRSGRDTDGVCITGELFVALAFIEGSVCIVVSGNDQVGVALTGGGGGGIGADGTVGVAYHHSDAAEIYDLEGPFVIGGGSAAVGVGGQLEAFVGAGHCSQIVGGGMGGVILGAGASGQVGATNTLVLGVGNPKSKCGL